MECIYRLFEQHPIICTDSRNITADSIFFALKGDHFDGNRYALQALDAGVAYAVVDDTTLPPHPQLIQVVDTLKALQDLASTHRRKLGIPVIAITGTNGKTTTKELTAQVLSAKFKVGVTSGNLNNHIGVPLTLLRMTAGTQIGVVEMGANHPCEIAALCRIALPDYGLITNVGKAHLQGFGSLEGVCKAKGELYDYLAATSGAIFYNTGNPLLCRMVNERNPPKIHPYGIAENHAAVVCPSGDAHPFLHLTVEGYPDIRTHLIGNYNTDNVLAALAVGAAFGVSPDAAAAAINHYEPSNNRSQLLHTARHTIIMDAYNANPASMTAAIENFAQLPATGKYAILGDMLELGAESATEHAAIIALLKEKPFTDVLLVGTQFTQAAVGVLFKSFADIAALRAYLRQHPIASQATILLKASRGMHLEDIVPEL
ncbi:MAG: UDP-N-acetylmuramoyl-tripeptide--D-alanyl-D-alanine ligase [Prevotellaceae bacterium]|jgi:UDP-N-acetylmuramoyl-tripeptide--D-alanyl-D-alanine ligase|nr:UDP-N-acetylmuramoyl-tripeptide--D-alanyl-D-alanine ligase [Prevotellaceae bacterium]